MAAVFPTPVLTLPGLSRGNAAHLPSLAVGVARLPTDPVGFATLTFTGLQPGTDIVVLRGGTDDVLLDLNEAPGISYAYTYSLFSTPTVVDIAFYKAGFVPHTSIRNFTLPSSNAVLPIAQVADRNYRNPT